MLNSLLPHGSIRSLDLLCRRILFDHKLQDIKFYRNYKNSLRYSLTQRTNFAISSDYQNAWLQSYINFTVNLLLYQDLIIH